MSDERPPKQSLLSKFKEKGLQLPDWQFEIHFYAGIAMKNTVKGVPIKESYGLVE